MKGRDSERMVTAHEHATTDPDDIRPHSRPRRPLAPTSGFGRRIAIDCNDVARPCPRPAAAGSRNPLSGKRNDGMKGESVRSFQSMPRISCTRFRALVSVSAKFRALAPTRPPTQPLRQAESAEADLELRPNLVCSRPGKPSATRSRDRSAHRTPSSKPAQAGAARAVQKIKIRANRGMARRRSPVGYKAIAWAKVTAPGRRHSDQRSPTTRRFSPALDGTASGAPDQSSPPEPPSHRRSPAPARPSEQGRPQARSRLEKGYPQCLKTPLTQSAIHRRRFLCPRRWRQPILSGCSG